MRSRSVPVGYTPDEQPPSRPESWSEVGFVRRDAVRWFDPAVLARAGLRVVVSAAFGSYLDKRELQAVADDGYLDLRGDRRDPDGDLWIDYVADTGDGFDATYTVAHTVGRPELSPEGADRALPRGRLLILGGDQVYPTADPTAYEDRLVGPFTAALPWLPRDDEALALAIPGNHDWYDGLTSFLRVFGQCKAIGGWRTSQSRSYFAVRLSETWWLWGVDVQFGSYIDDPQLRYFDALPLESGHRVVLCSAEPTWVEARWDPSAYRNLAYLERKIIAHKGASVRVGLAGDSHHYARYAGDDGSQRITAGGGGAFLHPTHNLPSSTTVQTDPDDPETATRCRLVGDTRYPSERRSRRMAWGSLLLWLRNPKFLAVTGALHLMLVWGALADLTDPAGAAGTTVSADLRTLLGQVLGTTGSIALVALTAVALIGFAKPPEALVHRDRRNGGPDADDGDDVRRAEIRRVVLKVAMGGLHALAHVVALLLVVLFATWLAGTLAGPDAAADGVPVAAVAAATAVGAAVGSVAGAVVMGLYLAVTNLTLGAHDNETFSAQRRTGHRSFLRLRLTPDETLEIHSIGIDTANTDWHVSPDGDPDQAWIAPDSPVRPRLVDRVEVR